jgi:hypothetical protein
MTTLSFFGDVISSYSRSDAIGDGVLVEVPRHLCKEAGITVPVATTPRVWDLIDPGDLEQMPGQSVTGRLWDVLNLLTLAARATKGKHISIINFKVVFLLRQQAINSEITTRKTVILKSVCGPGDHGEPVITIMLPNED